MELLQLWIWNVWDFIDLNVYVLSFGIAVVLAWIRLGRISHELKQLNRQVLKVGSMVRELEDLNGRTAFRFRLRKNSDQGLEKSIMAPLKAAPPIAATKFKGVLDVRRPAAATSGPGPVGEARRSEARPEGMRSLTTA